MLSIEVLNIDERSIEIKVKGETYTLFSPLVEYLSKDPDVQYVQLDVDHPLLENTYFKIGVRKGSPLEVLERTINTILKDLEELEKGFSL
ncbi:MAG: DNA-directed RNA polymerase subunit L [Pyrobaculum sp.]|jgi:DNA-directed RNA polymerase subunit L